MLTQAALMFQSLSARCSVAEEDYHLLLSQGFGTPEEFFYGVPDKTALETFVTGTFYQSIGMVDEYDNYIPQPRNSLITGVLDAQAFARGANASSLRRLWHICKALAEYELKNLAGQVSGQSFDLSGRKPYIPSLTKAYVNGRYVTKL